MDLYLTCFTTFWFYLKKKCQNWWIVKAIMNLDHLSFEFATLAETTQVHFISKGNIYQFNFCQVCVSYLAERVGFFIEWHLIYHALEEIINYIWAVVLNCCLINVPRIYCMSNPLANSLCDNKTNRPTKPNYVLYSK